MATAGALLWSVAPGFGENAGPVAIVAAENVYGDVARQIGGPDVTISSIIATPGQDPHQFEASPATAPGWPRSPGIWICPPGRPGRE